MPMLMPVSAQGEARLKEAVSHGRVAWTMRGLPPDQYLIGVHRDVYGSDACTRRRNGRQRAK